MKNEKYYVKAQSEVQEEELQEEVLQENHADEYQSSEENDKQIQPKTQKETDEKKQLEHLTSVLGVSPFKYQVVLF